MARKTAKVPPELAAARQRLERWRAGGRPRRRLPESMWTMAAELVAAHGVYRVARTLALDYNKLKKAAEVRGGRARQAKKATFVQVAAAAPAPAGPGDGYAVELRDGNGRHMAIRMPSSLDPARLVTAFLEGSTCSK